MTSRTSIHLIGQVLRQVVILGVRARLPRSLCIGLHLMLQVLLYAMPSGVQKCILFSGAGM